MPVSSPFLSFGKLSNPQKKRTEPPSWQCQDFYFIRYNIAVTQQPFNPSTFILTMFNSLTLTLSSLQGVDFESVEKKAKMAEAETR